MTDMPHETITIDTDQWAVVPRVPTKAMVEAGGYDYCKENSEVFQAMLAAAPRPEPVQQSEIPAGAIHNGRVLADRLEQNYGFECESGSLAMCSEWQEFRACFEHLANALQQPAPRPGFAEQLEIKTLSTQLNAVTELLRAREREIAELKKEAPRPVPAEDQVLVNRDIVLWLLGENGDFECPPDQYFRGKPTPYFWRKALRQATTGLQRPAEVEP
jgi:hypothetical protein